MPALADDNGNGNAGVFGGRCGNKPGIGIPPFALGGARFPGYGNGTIRKIFCGGAAGLGNGLHAL